MQEVDKKGKTQERCYTGPILSTAGSQRGSVGISRRGIEGAHMGGVFLSQDTIYFG